MMMIYINMDFCGNFIIREEIIRLRVRCFKKLIISVIFIVVGVFGDFFGGFFL